MDQDSSEAAEEKNSLEPPLTGEEKRHIESLPLTEEEKEAVCAYRDGDEETITFKTAEEAIRWLDGKAPAP